MADDQNLEKTLNALMLLGLRGMSQKEQIALLNQAGFGQTQIAKIIDSTPNAVGVRLAELRRTRKK